MPMTKFLCPDDKLVSIKTCLKDQGCRLKKRCLTKATLIELGKVRKWKGIPSTTQLIKGTMEAYLSITKNYDERPDKMMFMLLGTAVHNGLEQNEMGDMESEFAHITKDGISMIADLLETEDSWNILTDYKTSGSYKVMKALGIYGELIESDAICKQKTWYTDPESKEKFARIKGENRLIKVWRQNINRQDCLDWVRQLNYYRIGTEEKYDIKVDELRIQAIVRDGGLQIARTRGLENNSYLIPIPIVPDDPIKKYFNNKKDALLEALSKGNDDDVPICTDEERWGDNKCQNYCSVKKFCRYGSAEKWMKEEK